MKEKSMYQLVDDQLLSLIMTWSELIDRMEKSALAIPGDAYDWEDDIGYVCPELLHTRMYEEMAQNVMLMSRSLICKAEDIGLISLDDWRVINHILWFAGTDHPIVEEDLRP